MKRLGFSKGKNFGRWEGPRGLKSITVLNFAAVGQTVAQICGFFKMAVTIVLDFQKVGISGVGKFRRVKCVTVPNFAAVGQTVAKIWPFLIFQDSGCCHLRFSEFGDFRVGKGQEGQNASLGQISR